MNDSASLIATLGAPSGHLAFEPGCLFIGGEWRDGRGGMTFETIDPTTEEVITQVAQATVDEL